jgi:CPA2 family monovalent cation:H+ antiporter-2
MLSLDPLVTISILLAVALLGGMVAHRLRQPVMLGYLIIGIVAGPYSLGWISDVDMVQAAAAVGVTLLMFTVGLEISLAELRESGRVGIWGGLAQIAITFIAGAAAGLWLFRWPWEQAIIFGLILSLSSTAICLKLLMEKGEMDSVHGRIMVAFLILQDISVVIMMIILPVMGGKVDNLALELAVATGKAALFIGAALVLGQWILPWLFGNVGGIRSRELFLLTVLVLCLGATIGTHFLGLSMVFGAFLIGIVLRSTRFVHQALAEITPLRDIFATLFFVSIGMLLNPAFLAANWQPVLALVALIIVVKTIVVFSIIRLFGYNNRVAILSAAGLFQIGEFAFVLAQGGADQGIISDYFYSLILASTVITMLLTPLLAALAARIYHRAANRQTDRAIASIEACQPGSTGRRVIIAGFGHVGHNLARGLDDAGIPYVIIDIDPTCSLDAETCSMPRLYGDASNPLVLAQADLCNADTLVITFPYALAVTATAKAALTINPDLRVLARCSNDREARELRALGVAEMVNPEYEAGFKFLKQVLKLSGIDKDERKQIVDGVRRSESRGQDLL